MHYHVIVVEGESEVVGGAGRFVETFEGWREAENHARVISFEGEGWLPTRYPGRSWKPGEVAAYLDRRVLGRRVPQREVSVVRCPGAGREINAECYSFGVVMPLPDSSDSD